MTCPNCNGKVRVVDNTSVDARNEDYRKRKCTVCGHIFYTVEFEVECDESLKQDWVNYNRAYGPRALRHTRRKRS
jgi:transcriptional regulator NrdR family protein